MSALRPAIDAEIKRLCLESGIPARKLAIRAGVPVRALQRWLNGNQRSYNVVSADAVYHVLTGRPLLCCRCKPGTAKHKG